VIQKLMPSAPHQTILVLDGNTGQNGLTQVKAFHEALELSSLIITKVDGTAKGGVLCAISHAFQSDNTHPRILGLGVGEQVDQIAPFSAKTFAKELLQN
jgi:fused signal recognition particle receptor